MYKNISEVTLESLKQNATLAHYFGLGFIQIKLGERYRIHFYTDRLPAIIGDEEIHNHRYGFTSHILAGVFEQEIFGVVEGDSHTLEKESCKEGVHSDVAPKICSIKKIMSQRLTEGSSYYVADSVFHRVSSKFAVTLLDRDPAAKELAEVVRPINATKVCPFGKKVEDDELWDIVDEILNKAHRSK